MLRRSIDIAVFGATGFTGRLVATHLATLYGDQLRIAAAGRDADRLDRLRVALGEERISTIVADANDPESLKQLAASARVIISTVGPYHSHGTGLVQACAEAGTDYCDLSAEPDWILGMIREQEGQTFFWIREVEGHKRTAGFENAEQRNNHVNRTLQTDADQSLWPNT